MNLKIILLNERSQIPPPKKYIYTEGMIPFTLYPKECKLISNDRKWNSAYLSVCMGGGEGATTEGYKGVA